MLGEVQDPSADLFSLAAVLYFCLTGAPPFGESETKVILARILAGQVDTSGLPPEIGKWVKRAMSADASERFADASEMQIAWRRAVRIVLDREQDVPWWRRFFSGEHQSPGA